MKKNLFTRHLRFREALTEDQTEHIRERLTRLEGVETCRLDGRQLELRYDPLRVDLRHVLALLEEMRLPLDTHWLQQCLRAWYQYQDEAVRENAGAPPPACCNRPPPGGRTHEG